MVASYASMSFAEEHCPLEDPSAGLHVLVVEDDADTANSMALLLRMAGHEVRVAMDGVTALHTAAESHPDVILLDIGIPLIDGYQLARQLRQLPLSKRPFLIAVTGHALEQDRRSSSEAGIDLHFLKPVDFKHLQKLLERFQRVVGPEV